MRKLTYIATFVCVGVLAGSSDVHAGWKQSCGRMAYKLGRIAAAIAKPVTQGIFPVVHPLMLTRLENYVWFAKEAELGRIPDGTIVKAEHTKFKRTKGTEYDLETYFVKDQGEWWKIIVSKREGPYSTSVIREGVAFNPKEFRNFPAEFGEVVLGDSTKQNSPEVSHFFSQLADLKGPNPQWSKAPQEVSGAWKVLRQQAMLKKQGVLKFVVPKTFRKTYVSDGGAVASQFSHGQQLAFAFGFLTTPVPVLWGVEGFPSSWNWNAVIAAYGLTLTYGCGNKILCSIHSIFQKNFEKNYVDDLTQISEGSLTPKLSGRAREAKALPVETKAAESSQATNDEVQAVKTPDAPTTEVELPDGEQRLKEWTAAVHEWRGHVSTRSDARRAKDSIDPWDLLELQKEKFRATSIEDFLTNSVVNKKITTRQTEILFERYRKNFKSDGEFYDFLNKAAKQVFQRVSEADKHEGKVWKWTLWSPREIDLIEFQTALDRHMMKESDATRRALQASFNQLQSNMIYDRKLFLEEIRAMLKVRRERIASLKKATEAAVIPEEDGTESVPSEKSAIKPQATKKSAASKTEPLPVLKISPEQQARIEAIETKITSIRDRFEKLKAIEDRAEKIRKRDPGARSVVKKVSAILREIKSTKQEFRTQAKALVKEQDALKRGETPDAVPFDDAADFADLENRLNALSSPKIDESNSSPEASE